MESVGVALFGQTVDDWAARVAEVHYFSGLVDGLTSSIIDGLTQDLHLEMAFEEQDLGVATRDKETDEGELRDNALIVFLDKMGKDMCLKVVDLNKRDVLGESERLGEGDADHEGTEEAGPPGEGDGVDVRF